MRGVRYGVGDRSYPCITPADSLANWAGVSQGPAISVSHRRHHTGCENHINEYGHEREEALQSGIGNECSDLTRNIAGRVVNTRVVISRTGAMRQPQIGGPEYWF